MTCRGSGRCETFSKLLPPLGNNLANALRGGAGWSRRPT